MRTVIRYALVLSLSLLGGCAEKRVALVIGEGKYPGGFWRSLPTPPNDAADMAKKLEAAGIHVRLKTNLDNKAFQAAMDDFGRTTKDARVAVVFYAGHGIQLSVMDDVTQQVNAIDFLVPVDSLKIMRRIYKESEVPEKLIRVSKLIEAMGSAKTKLVLLDACRSIPPWPEHGLAQSVPVPDNTLIAYAAQAGGITGDEALTRINAADKAIKFRREKNSPFTRALAAHIADENLDVHQMLALVLRDAQEIPEATESVDSPGFYYTPILPKYADGKSLASRPAFYSRLTHDFFLVHRHIPN